MGGSERGGREGVYLGVSFSLRVTIPSIFLFDLENLSLC